MSALAHFADLRRTSPEVREVARTGHFYCYGYAKARNSTEMKLEKGTYAVGKG